MVHEAAKELGYVFKQRESSKNVLEIKQFLLIATEFALSQKSFFGRIIDRLEKNCTENNASFLVRGVTTEMIDNLQIPEILSKIEFDGLFILSHISTSYIEKLLNLELPTIMIDHHQPTLDADTVISENYTGAFQAITYLIETGCNQIGFIGDVNFSPSYDERFLGYKRAMQHQKKLTYPDFEITNIKENHVELYNRLEQLEEMPDGWFCVNSGLAFILNSFLLTKGYQVPKDISIISFDNTEFNLLAQPQISSIATDLDFMADSALELMKKRISYPALPYTQVAIIPTLMLRGSIKTMPIK